MKCFMEFEIVFYQVYDALGMVNHAHDVRNGLGTRRKLLQMVYDCYAEPHRHYHTIDHVVEMLEALHTVAIHTIKFSKDELAALCLAVLFHDIHYVPERMDNEERSCDVFLKCFDDRQRHAFGLSEGRAVNICDQVLSLIRCTRNHVGNNLPEKAMCQLDLEVFERSFAGLIKYEHQIFREYQHVPLREYIPARIEVLRKYEKITQCDMKSLIAYVHRRPYRIGVYPGSFDPFHQGHLDVLRQAERVFDKVILARGINMEKKDPTHGWPTTLHNEKILYHGLLSTLMEGTCGSIPDVDVQFTIVRGLRNLTDLQGEIAMNRFVTQMCPSARFAYFVCAAEREHLSSSGIRQIERFDESMAKGFGVP